VSPSGSLEGFAFSISGPYPPNRPPVGHRHHRHPRCHHHGGNSAAAVTAAAGQRRLANRWGGWYATLAAIAGYLVVTVGAIVLLPTYNEVPADFPAIVLYEFRRASLITQLALWGTIAVILGELLHRLQRASDLDAVEPDYAEQSL
jgi:predicted cobalt transporter CbtA